MVEYVGNVNAAPTYTEGALGVDTEIASSPASIIQRGVKLTPGQGVLLAGRVLGQVTATKLYSAYNNSLSDGTETAVGVLRQSVDTGSDANAAPVFANIVIAGVLKKSVLSGADSYAITDLNARQHTGLDVFIF